MSVDVTVAGPLLDQGADAVVLGLGGDSSGEELPVLQVPTAVVSVGGAPVLDHPDTTMIWGRGTDGYRWALRHLKYRLDFPPQTVPYGGHPDQVADLRAPDDRSSHPAVALIHGGFWKPPWLRDVMDGLAVDLLRLGYATWNIEYRRVGSGGGWPTTFDDVLAAIDHLADLETVDPDRVTVLGHSAGGHLALWVSLLRPFGSTRARRVRPTKAVSLAGVSDLEVAAEELLGGGAVAGLLGTSAGDPEVVRLANPRARLPIGIRQLVVHGTVDEEVPVAVSRDYARAAEVAGDDVDYLELDGVGHMELIDPHSEAWHAISDSLAW